MVKYTCSFPLAVGVFPVDVEIAMEWTMPFTSCLQRAYRRWWAEGAGQEAGCVEVESAVRLRNGDNANRSIPVRSSKRFHHGRSSLTGASGELALSAASI